MSDTLVLGYLGEGVLNILGCVKTNFSFISFSTDELEMHIMLQGMTSWHHSYWFVMDFSLLHLVFDPGK